MLSRAALDRVFDPLDPGFREDIGPRFDPVQPQADIDALLLKLARQRGGNDQVDISIGQDELQRIRRFLVFASQARSCLVRPKRHVSHHTRRVVD